MSHTVASHIAHKMQFSRGQVGQHALHNIQIIFAQVPDKGTVLTKCLQNQRLGVYSDGDHSQQVS